MTRRRALTCVIVALLAIGVGLLIDVTNGLRRLELSTVDVRFSLRGAQEAPSDIVIVAIDDKTLDAGQGSELPLDRTRHAKVIERLTAAGAGVIAYDVQFTEPSGDTDEAIEADNALIEAVAASPKVVLGTTLGAPDGNIFGGGEGYEYSGATAGNTLYPDDVDGRIRRMPFSTDGLTNFAVAAARVQKGVKVPQTGEAWIDYPGPPGTFPALSFVDVEEGRFDPAAVRGRVVVVGATAPRTRDLHATSTSPDGRMPGPEVEAAAIATVMAGFALDDASGWLALLAIAVLGVVGPLTALRLNAALALLATFVAAAVYLVVVQLAFNGGTILPVVAPLVAATLGAAGALAVAPPKRAPWMDRMLDRLTGTRGNQRTRRLRATLLIGAALSVITVVILADAIHALRSVDNSSVDWRFRVRGAVEPPKDVIVVAIDDRTFNSDGVSFPLDRAMHAEVIDHLAKAGARVIAYDIEFSEPSASEKSDNALIESIRRAGNVVLSTTDLGSATDAQLLQFGKGLAYSRGLPGWTQVIEDPDGKIRRMPFTIQGKPLFPIVVAEQMRGGRTLETPDGDSAWIDFAGPDRTLDYLSFIDVVRDDFDAAEVRGKAVVVGATQTSLQDLHHTSTTTNVQMPGPEIQATSISTALAGFPLRSAPWWLNALLIVVVGVAAPLVALRRGILLAVVAGVATIGVYLVGAQLAFERADLLVTVVYPVLAGIVMILATAAIHGLTVAFEREQARDAFARFVPEAVVDQVLADAEGVRLGGVRREGTVMFSDLRGFTSFSETLEPERVIEALNLYLTAMSEAILDHGGTLVAYMGDGIMAVFGAPLQQDDHADRALEAAREMLERLEGFNQWLRDEGMHDGFKMGIGLNSGPVMSGNVGSERRLEYTALGDTTNTAARLEGMTKGTPHQLYIADTTKQRLTRPAEDLVAVGEVEVRGRKAKVLLWSLGDETAPRAAPATEKPAGAAQS